LSDRKFAEHLEKTLAKYMLFIALLFGMSPAALSQQIASDNPEMELILEADQEIRKSYSAEKARDKEFVSRMIAEDEARRARTAELLGQGALLTANDFFRAAFIYQHGGEPSSYLLAHTLAVAAASLGHEKGGVDRCCLA
jgi:uncharacterized protein YhaN